MRFPRGKYKGRSIAEVEMIDPGYIRWCKENTPWMLEQAKSTKPKITKKEDYSYLDEVEDFRKLKTLQHILFRNPIKPEDAF